MKRLEKLLLLTAVAAALACGDPAEDRSGDRQPTPEEPAATEAAEAEGRDETRREAARNEKRTAVENLEARLEGVRERVSALEAEAEAVRDRIGDALRASLDRLEAKADEARQDVSRFADAGLDGWERERASIADRLDDLEATVDEVSRTLAGQKRVVERRDRSRCPVTGLFEALDGGDYQAYRVSVVSEVQTALREQGYYPGPVDGFLGLPTMEAIASFQEDHGVRPTGVPSPETRERLLRS